MKINHNINGKLIKRYKRFLADIQLENGQTIVAHCPNTGAMTSCLGDGWPVRLSYTESNNRKYPHTLQQVYNGDSWICVNTQVANQLIKDSIAKQLIPEFNGDYSWRAEPKYGESTKFDFLLERNGETEWVEVKSVTLLENRQVMFPDTVTLRGQKHVRELMNAVKNGDNATLLFVVLRGDSNKFSIADHIDPEYSTLIRQAVKAGVRILVKKTHLSATEISLGESIAHAYSS